MLSSLFALVNVFAVAAFRDSIEDESFLSLISAFKSATVNSEGAKKILFQVLDLIKAFAVDHD